MVFSSIDHAGRYAFSNQPGIGYWNLGALAQALLPILNDDPEQAVAMAQHAVDAYEPLYRQAYRDGMARKIGITHCLDEDQTLIDELLATMAEHGTDFTLTFRRLAELAQPEPDDAAGISSFFDLGPAFQDWLARWQQRTAADPMTPEQRRATMLAINPVFIPRNHLVQEVIEAAIDHGDLKPFHQLLEITAQPYAYNPEHQRYAVPPRQEQVVRQTFCGT